MDHEIAQYILCTSNTGALCAYDREDGMMLFHWFLCHTWWLFFSFVDYLFSNCFICTSSVQICYLTTVTLKTKEKILYPNIEIVNYVKIIITAPNIIVTAPNIVVIPISSSFTRYYYCKASIKFHLWIRLLYPQLRH